ncbi:MAG: ABC transporter permease [Candidatus Anstonellales archaeon]
MNAKDVFEYATRNLSHRSLRSWLTLIGIIIGIATIVVLMGIAQGVKGYVEEQMEVFGEDKLAIVPISMDSITSRGALTGRGPTSGKLTEKDAEDIETLPEVETVAKMNMGRTTIEFRGVELYSPVFPGDTAGFKMWEDYFKVEEGRYPEENERGVVFIGNDIANKYFGKNRIRVGNYMTIGGKKFRVVGIAERIGTALSEQDDAVIFIPYEDGKEMFKDVLAKDEVYTIMVDLKDGANVNEVKEKIEEILARNHHVSLDEKDFTVMTRDFIMEITDAVMGMLTSFLFAIAVVSSIIGGIGIANTMYMAVAEKRREIGVLKSIGATKKQIIILFIAEAGIIGLLGGILGLAVGWIGAEIVNSFGIPYVITPELFAFALLYGAAVGILAGYFPAKSAAEIPAIEALRY